MIDPKELRIGNWVEMDNDCNYQDWVGIWIPQQVKNGSYIDNYAHMCRPIPLTPDILVKCGFECKVLDEIGSVWHFGVNPINQDWMIKLTWIIGYEHPFFLNYHHTVKCLHQLQNLYFALTGTEIEYKP